MVFIDGGRAHLLKKPFRVWPELKYPFPFEYSYKLGKKRGEPFPESLPQASQTSRGRAYIGHAHLGLPQRSRVLRW